MSDTDKQRNLITECTELLKTNHNIILTGAPGTGKTYLAKQIAAKMIGKEYKGEDTDNDPDFKKYVRLVQFHPSYDYTDFVEGLRPIYEDGHIGFERKDGIFKAFCELAINNKKEIEKLIEKVIEEEIEEGTKAIFEIISKIQTFSFKHNSVCKESTNTATIDNCNTTAITITANFGQNVGDIKFDYSTKNIVNFIKTKAKVQDINKILLDDRQINNVPSVCVASVYKGICDLIINFNPIPEHVFIIDEINRGEISKIFGELFFSIDPGYRGIKGRVDTQYQNLITDDTDCFINGFYVPENVYIIGTMNDIDRSVESMDFAFRRRFAFKEIKAEDTMYILGDDKNAKARMAKLNEAISHIEGLSDAYHIGASYFLKLKEYDNDFEKLWNHHIKGLVEEYLRGREGNKIEDLKRAYDEEDNQTER